MLYTYGVKIEQVTRRIPDFEIKGGIAASIDCFAYKKSNPKKKYTTYQRDTQFHGYYLPSVTSDPQGIRVFF